MRVPLVLAHDRSILKSNYPLVMCYQTVSAPRSHGDINADHSEPGYYEDGNFGVRIENMIMAREASTKHHFGDKPWLAFEHVTMVPMCKKLTDTALLTADEKTWLNDYHKEIWEKTSSFFTDDQRTTEWLRRETQEI
jgi:Xaa-Pro aminopeptidase